jgi:sulfate transport system permease protein
MTVAAAANPAVLSAHERIAARDAAWVRRCLIGGTLSFLGLFLILPLAVVFYEAFADGAKVYFSSLFNRYTGHAVWLTLVSAGIAVPANLIFGVAASWAIAKFEFKGKSLLISLIDIPFAVSPVISGLIFVLVFGRNGWFGPWLEEHNIRVIFAVPGIVLATIFVTFPYVARELIPLMQEQGSDEEQAALALGASGWKTFFRVTLPNIKWSLLYGVLLCNARAMGEFGAVSVVSGHIQGKTNTIPLHVELLYASHTAAAFAVASLLAMLALLTLVAKATLEWKLQQQARRLAAESETE